MSVFTFVVDAHAGQFGETAPSEAAMIRELMAQAAGAIGALQVPTESAPASLVLNRIDGSGVCVAIVVGTFCFGADSHAVAESNARAATQAAAKAKSRPKAA